jgi:hypothetical protein
MLNYMKNHRKIEFLYSLLTIDDKNDLLDLLLKDEELNLRVEYDDISLGDWLDNYIMKENISISVRLFNCLRTASSRYEYRRRGKEIYLKEIDKVDIISIRNAGEKCWEEFERLRNTYNETIKKVI